MGFTGGNLASLLVVFLYSLHGKLHNGFKNEISMNSYECQNGGHAYHPRSLSKGVYYVGLRMRFPIWLYEGSYYLVPEADDTSLMMWIVRLDR